nr:unnamed protein product [Fasciola hepatica]
MVRQHTFARTELRVVLGTAKQLDDSAGINHFKVKSAPLTTAMSLPLLKAIDLSSLEPKEGWSLNGFLAVFEEQRQRIQFQLQKRIKSIDLAIEKFIALKAQIAALPTAVKEMPYFEFIKEDHHSPTLDASEVKTRSRMEWEESVRTRTGKRPRRGAQCTTQKRLHPSTVKRGANPDSVTLNLQSIIETEQELASTEPANTNRTLTASRARVAKVPRSANVVASTPATNKPAVFAVPTSARLTRSRLAVSRQRIRIIKPTDTLTSGNGSPVLNPFALGNANAGEPSAIELQLLRTIQKHIQTYLGSIKS